jgi:hypothetical protein
MRNDAVRDGLHRREDEVIGLTGAQERMGSTGGREKGSWNQAVGAKG